MNYPNYDTPPSSPLDSPTIAMPPYLQQVMDALKERGIQVEDVRVTQMPPPAQEQRRSITFEIFDADGDYHVIPHVRAFDWQGEKLCIEHDGGTTFFCNPIKVHTDEKLVIRTK